MTDMQISTAEEIAASEAIDTLPVAQQCARQGDLVLLRIGDLEANELPRTKRGGILLGAGRHGEHRLIGRARIKRRTSEYIDVETDGSMVVHTDQPAGRHRTICLAPGLWRATRQKELGLDLAVRTVED